MKILIVDTYYADFLDTIYRQNPGLAHQPYAQQWRYLMDQCFGTSNYYSLNLKQLGHDAEEVIYNCLPLQRQWAREHGIRMRTLVVGRGEFYGIPTPFRRNYHKWRHEALLAQVRAQRPDVLYFQDPYLAGEFLPEVRPYVSLVVAQHASALKPDRALPAVDLLVSSLPNLVDYARHNGLQAEYLRLGFESTLLRRLPAEPHYEHNVVHIGGYGPIHSERNRFLEEVARLVNVEFWGYALDSLSPDSPIRRSYRGQAWGLEMYRIRRASRIVLSMHISAVAGPWANIMTLYEATGVGSLLLIDERRDLADIFVPGREVITYKDAHECGAKIQYYLAHDQERCAIATAGQSRTLRDHSYHLRMQELAGMLERRLARGHRT